MNDDAVQADYYQRTASSYEEAHVTAGDEHFITLEYVAGLCATIRAASVLDVGAGTGRAVRFLNERRPGMRVVGLEPVEGLRKIARDAGGEFFDGTGESLPFQDDEFDVVLATAVMHHVPDPTVVLAEMTRVARKAVMISDSNRFGAGRPAARLAKVGLNASGMWGLYIKLRTRGKGFMVSDGDGLFYSYSLFDSLPQVADWADRAFVIPTKGLPLRRWTGTLLSAEQGLLVGVREPCFEGWAEEATP